MPKRPLNPCRHPGCPNLTSDRFCNEHVKMYQRASAEERGYDGRWKKRSMSFLKAHPLCEACMEQNKLMPATVVDHIVPHRGDPLLMWDESNWRALCKRCHDRKTGRYDSTVPYSY